MTRRPDPEHLAAAECRMWRDYYARRLARLAVRLVGVLRRQFGVRYRAAFRAGFLFSRAAILFRKMYLNPDRLPDGRQQVLAQLRRGYALLAAETGENFDPARVAEAELAWWEVRRSGAEVPAEQVGACIADLYAALYGGPAETYLPAAGLRAEAARLRDRTEGHTDWAEIERMLLESYRELARVT